MFAKFIDENTIEPAPNVKDGVFFNYDSDLNSEMLLADGYLPVDETPQPGSDYLQKYQLTDDKIVMFWEKVVQPVDFETLRQNKLMDVQQEFYRKRTTETAEYGGMYFSVHENAKQNLTSVVVLAQTLGGDIQYCEADGTVHSFTLEEFKPVAAAISNKIKALEFHYYELEKAILAADDETELEAVSWEQKSVILFWIRSTSRFGRTNMSL